MGNFHVHSKSGPCLPVAVAGEPRMRLAKVLEAGLMLRCSMYSSVTVLVSQYARQALLSGCASICTRNQCVSEQEGT